jgi:hypothetical protein
MATILRRRRLARFLCFSALTLLVLSVVPLWPWRPACRCETVWWGDLRDAYVDFVAEALDRSGIYHWRFADLILLRPVPWLDDHELVPRSEDIYDIECKVAEMLGDDVTLDGVLYRAPEALQRLKVEMADRIGPDPRFDAQGRRRIAADTRITLFCPLFRAAILEPPRPAER